MAAGSPPDSDSVEMKAMLDHTQELTTVLSSKPLAVAEALVHKGFFRNEILEEIFVDKTVEGKSRILVEAARKKIELAPEKLEELLEILSEQTWTKDIAERLRSIKQSKLSQANVYRHPSVRHPVATS